MKKRLIFQLLALGLIFPIVSLGGQMNLLNPDARLEKFKKKIQFDESLSKESVGPLISTIHIEPNKYPQLEGWALDQKTNSLRGEELFNEWIFKKNKESLLIQVYLSHKGVAETRRRFLEAVDSTSTMEIPFDKGPDGIGTISAIPLQRPYDYVVFIYKNTYVHVRSYGSAIDALAVCKSIYAEINKK
jgi:hypothetical protein